MDQPFREMLGLLSGDESPRGGVPSGVVDAARRAGVLDLLGREPAVRANGINEAGNQKISKTLTPALPRYIIDFRHYSAFQTFIRNYTDRRPRTADRR